MRIIVDDLTGCEIRELLTTHFAGMLESSPEGSCHFLDFDGLNSPDVTFWSIWSDDDSEGSSLLGCGAIKEHDSKLGEVKSMRTHEDHLRKGVAAKMLTHIIEQAEKRGYERLSLETGSGPAFEPAIALYKRFGFEICDPFGNYELDPFSVFMTYELSR